MFLFFLFNFVVASKFDKLSKALTKKTVLIFFVAAVVLIAIDFAFKIFYEKKKEKLYKEIKKIINEIDKIDSKEEIKIKELTKDLYGHIGIYLDMSLINYDEIQGKILNSKTKFCELLRKFFKYSYNKLRNIKPLEDVDITYVYVSQKEITIEKEEKKGFEKLFFCQFISISSRMFFVKFYVDLTDAAVEQF